MAEKLNAGHAKARALVAFPGQTPGSTMTGRQGDAGGDGRPGVPGLDDRMEGGGVTEYSREASRRMTDA